MSDLLWLCNLLIQSSINRGQRRHQSAPELPEELPHFTIVTSASCHTDSTSSLQKLILLLRGAGARVTLFSSSCVSFVFSLAAIPTDFSSSAIFYISGLLVAFLFFNTVSRWILKQNKMWGMHQGMSQNAPGHVPDCSPSHHSYLFSCLPHCALNSLSTGKLAYSPFVSKDWLTFCMFPVTWEYLAKCMAFYFLNEKKKNPQCIIFQLKFCSFLYFPFKSVPKCLFCVIKNSIKGKETLNTLGSVDDQAIPRLVASEFGRMKSEC